MAPEDYVAALHARTGSRRHIAKLQDLARSKAMTLYPEAPSSDSRYGIRSENEIYQRLGLQYIPPELREDEGEIEAASAGTLPQPLALADIRGMTHCHTVYSDGRNSIEEMALAAEAMGMTYLTITDHSQSAYYAGGVGIDRLRAQWDEIARVQERVKIKLLKGTESDILEDGSLDYPDHLLDQFDIIIASIHARHKMDSDQMTRRLLRALKLPFFKIWGHPLGRLIQSRPPFACRMEEVLDAVAESRCAIEVNGDPHRLDLEPHWIRAGSQSRHQIHRIDGRTFHCWLGKFAFWRVHGAAWLAHARRGFEYPRCRRFHAGRSSMNRVFVLSPANCNGVRARWLLRKNSRSELAQRLRGSGAPLAEVFSFLSSLYFRGKLSYAQAFARPPVRLPWDFYHYADRRSRTARYC